MVVSKHTNHVTGTNYERGRIQNAKYSLVEENLLDIESKPDSANGTSVAT